MFLYLCQFQASFGALPLEVLSPIVILRRALPFMFVLIGLFSLKHLETESYKIGSVFVYINMEIYQNLLKEQLKH
ncbi:hypothetical protein CEH05_12565 [Halobacillus halophilus]|nr:hypothetical protein CEH05_12565 [Halobacillus halophilus]